MVHLGKLTRAGGAEELIELGKLLRGRVRLELAGPADKTMRPMMLRAHDEGSVVWHGDLPAERMRTLVADSLTVLSPSRGLPFRNPPAAAAMILALRAETAARPGIPAANSP